MSATVTDKVPARQVGEPKTKGAHGKVKIAWGRLTHKVRVLEQRITRVTATPRGWMIIACVLVGISGTWRHLRDLKFGWLEKESATCPFPLAELPTVVGSWAAVPGVKGELDPEIVKLAGASEHWVRVYRDEKTGEDATVIVLYGKATSVFSHTPKVCYPAKSFKMVQTPVVKPLPLRDSAPGHYEQAVYTKKISGLSRFMEASHTFLHNHEWTPDVASRWKMFRSYPGMFKIQIDRPTSFGTEDTPTESLMVGLADEINRRLAHPEPRAHRPGAHAAGEHPVTTDLPSGKPAATRGG